MQASIVDLRYKTKSILTALKRGETVSLYYHGHEAGQIIPVSQQSAVSCADHPFFGSGKRIRSRQSVKTLMTSLRKPRYDF